MCPAHLTSGMEEDVGNERQVSLTAEMLLCPSINAEPAYIETALFSMGWEEDLDAWRTPSSLWAQAFEKLYNWFILKSGLPNILSPWPLQAPTPNPSFPKVIHSMAQVVIQVETSPLLFFGQLGCNSCTPSFYQKFPVLPSSCLASAIPFPWFQD